MIRLAVIVACLHVASAASGTLRVAMSQVLSTSINTTAATLAAHLDLVNSTLAQAAADDVDIVIYPEGFLQVHAVAFVEPRYACTSCLHGWLHSLPPCVIPRALVSLCAVCWLNGVAGVQPDGGAVRRGCGWTVFPTCRIAR